MRLVLTVVCTLFVWWVILPFGYETVTGRWAPKWMEAPWARDRTAPPPCLTCGGGF